MVPHFDLPFKFGGVVEQSTVPDLANCVFAIVATPKGWRQERPAFGTEDLTFAPSPVMNQNVRQGIAQQEPRASLLFDERDGMDKLERLVKISVDNA